VKPPCEVICKYVLPSARALIARNLIDKYGYTQMKAAEKLGVTQSAMSRYITLNRGSSIEVIKEVHELAEDVARDIATSETSLEEMIEKTCYICNALRKSGKLCKLHRKTVVTHPKKCNICLKVPKHPSH